MDQDATWYEGRPRPRRHCVRWEPSCPHGKGHSSPHFSGHVYCGQMVAHLSNCWALVLEQYRPAGACTVLYCSILWGRWEGGSPTLRCVLHEPLAPCPKSTILPFIHSRSVHHRQLVSHMRTTAWLRVCSCTFCVEGRVRNPAG